MSLVSRLILGYNIWKMSAGKQEAKKNTHISHLKKRVSSQISDSCHFHRGSCDFASCHPVAEGHVTDDSWRGSCGSVSICGGSHGSAAV